MRGWVCYRVLSLIQKSYWRKEITFILNIYLDPDYWNSVNNYSKGSYILLHLHFVITCRSIKFIVYKRLNVKSDTKYIELIKLSSKTNIN